MHYPDLQEQIQSIPTPKLTHCTKENLKSYFDNTWALYEMLFSSIKSDETLYQSPDPLRNPLIFYLGHTAAFYINKFKLAGLIEKGVDEKMDHLFAVGVDPDLPQHLNVSEYWPSVDTVRTYRKTIYDIVHQTIDQIKDSDLPIRPDSPLWAIPMTIEHDRIHFETSSMLIRQLDINLVKRPENWEYAPTLGHSPKNEWIKMEKANVVIGKSIDADLFGWDNEYGELEITVESFQATKNLISNADFWDFVQEGAYAKQQFWTTEGWAWKTRTNTTLPKFWKKNKDTFRYRAMFDEISMPMDWPVEVNAHEAWAYCAWKNDGSRLLSEAEFALISQEGRTKDYDPLYSKVYNLDFRYGSPTPVGYLSSGATASGFNDIYGNVWDWLKDDFYPLPDFKVHPYYEEFSAPYMDSEHSMLAGGSWITTGTGASKYYRLWFRRHFFQHAGFRLAKSL